MILPPFFLRHSCSIPVLLCLRLVLPCSLWGWVYILSPPHRSWSDVGRLYDVLFACPFCCGTDKYFFVRVLFCWVDPHYLALRLWRVGLLHLSSSTRQLITGDDRICVHRSVHCANNPHIYNRRTFPTSSFLAFTYLVLGCLLFLDEFPPPYRWINDQTPY